MKKIIVILFIVAILFSGCKKNDYSEFSSSNDTFEAEVKVEEEIRIYRKMVITSIYDKEVYVFERVNSGRIHNDYIAVYTDTGSAWFSVNGFTGIIFDEGVEYSLTKKE